jgi:hypothetical protein
LNREDRKELSQIEKTELKLQWLFNDLVAQTKVGEMLEWHEALEFKLRALRFLERKLVEMARDAPNVVRDEMQQPGVVLKFTGALIDQAQLNLEFFFYLGTAALDVLAKLTKRFYPKDQETFPSDRHLYFKNIIELITTTNIDKDFSKVLSAHQDWIISIYDNRNTLAHSAPAFIGFDKDHNIIFEKRNPDQTQLFRKHENANLVGYLEDTVSNLDTFLEQYLTHFRSRVAETARTQFLREKLWDLLMGRNCVTGRTFE